MKAVRLTASLLFLISRIAALVFIAIVLYATATVVIYAYTAAAWLPMVVRDEVFTIFYPFSKNPFLIGDYTTSWLVTYLSMLAFYAFFLWLLSDVFRAFRQPKLFTRQGVLRLSRFYITNFLVPVLFVLLVLFFHSEMGDVVQITFLHLVIGVFAWFMTAIFRQGLVLQEEQDLTF